MGGTLDRAYGYKGDFMNLPVADVEAALPFYETVLGFRVVSRGDSPHKWKVFYVVAPDGLCYWFGECQQETP